MTTWLLGVLATLFAGLNIFQFIFFRATKREYEAKAEKAETDSSAVKHDYLVKRIESMEKLYQQQGEILDGVRGTVLNLQRDVQDRDQKIIKYESVIASLTNKYEAEIATLISKVTRLEKEVQAYKTIAGK